MSEAVATLPREGGGTKKPSPRKQRAYERGTLGKGLGGAKNLVTKSGVGPVDTVLAAAVVGLIGFGVVMVYSASAFEAAVRANCARREASAVEFPDRVSGIVTNTTFFENLREESHE